MSMSTPSTKGARTTTVSEPEAKAQFFKLIRRVQLGEEFVITRNGVPAARIRPIRDEPRSDEAPDSPA
jgi:prevent-host-death family protein